jgi:hypothetical protein
MEHLPADAAGGQGLGKGLPRQVIDLYGFFANLFLEFHDGLLGIGMGSYPMAWVNSP